MGKKCIVTFCKIGYKSQNQIVAYIIQFYLQIRFREYLKVEMAEIIEISCLKKKEAKLCPN